MRYVLVVTLLVHLGMASVAEEVSFRVDYTVDALRNVKGGIEPGGAVMGRLDLIGDFRFGNNRFLMDLQAVHGGALSNFVGDFQTVSSVETTPRLQPFELYYERFFLDDRLSARTGLIALDDEFDIRETAELFVHSSPGVGGDLGQLGMNGPGIYPVPTFGGRLRYRDGPFYIQSAVVDGIPGDPDRPWSNQITFGRDDGLFVIGETGWVWEDDDQSFIGKAALGAWGFTEPYPTLVDETVTEGNRGAYVSLEKALGSDLAGYLRVGFTNGAINPIETFVGAGLVWTGPFPGRDEDALGLSVNTGFTGWDYRLAFPDSRSHETAIELTYAFRVNDNVTLQPDLQYVINPGFELPNALVAGFRAQFSFSP